MSNVAIPANPFGNPRNSQVTLPSRDASVSQQIGAILSSLTILGSLRLNLNEAKADDTTHGGKTDGGVAMAVEASIIQACNRLDLMLGENSRWSVETLGRLEQRMIDLYDKQTQMFEAQTKLANRFDSPQATMKPTLTRLADGNWAAMVGDPSTPNSVIGIGPTPAEALDNFDSVFRGGPTHLPKEFLEKYEKQKLDAGRNETTSQSRQSKSTLPGNRSADEPRPGTSEEKNMEHKKRKPRKPRKQYGY